VKSIKNLIGILFVVLIIILMAVTNPSKNAYDEWAKSQLSSTTDNSLAKGVIELIGAPIIDQATTKSNYILFSLFQTSYQGNTIKTIGLFNNFILISKS
jgi:hypothetical protein